MVRVIHMENSGIVLLACVALLVLGWVWVRVQLAPDEPDGTIVPTMV